MQSHTLPDGLMELARELEATHAPGLQKLWDSGVPMNAKHPLLATVEKADDELKGLRQDASAKHSKMTEAQTAVAEATAKGEKIGTEHDLFKQLEAAGKEYGELADSITDRERFKAALVEQMGQQGIDAGQKSDGGSSSDYAEEMKQLLQGGGLWTPQRKSMGERIVDSDEYKAAIESQRLFRQNYGEDVPLGKGLERAELKALITGASDTSAGAFVTPDRQGYFPLPLRPFTILDLITTGQTDSDLIEYVRMVSNTNNAAMVPEATGAGVIGDGTGGTITAAAGGRKPESGMAFEIVQEAVKTLAHWVPATKRSLADAAQVRTIIEGMLAWGLGDLLERQVIAGNGTGENFRGLLELTGSQSIGAGASSHADKVLKAQTKLIVAGFRGNGVAINPADAETIWLSRDNSGGAGTGGYLFGPPNGPGARTLWGMPVAESPAVPQGTALVGAFNTALLWLREGTQILASDSHVDFFTRNLVAILAEMRAAFGVPMPAAFVEVNLAAS